MNAASIKVPLCQPAASVPILGEPCQTSAMKRVASKASVLTSYNTGPRFASVYISSIAFLRFRNSGRNAASVSAWSKISPRRGKVSEGKVPLEKPSPTGKNFPMWVKISSRSDCRIWQPTTVRSFSSLLPLLVSLRRHKNVDPERAPAAGLTQLIHPRRPLLTAAGWAVHGFQITSTGV